MNSTQTPTVTDYQSILRDLIEIQHQWEGVTRKVQQGLEALYHLETMYVTNTEVEFPALITTDPNAPCIDGSEWPSAVALATLCQSWRRLYHEAKSVWSSLSEQSRIGLLSPETCSRLLDSAQS